MATESERARAAERSRMVETQIRARGVRHAGVLRALAAVPRHEFVPAASAPAAYEDRPLPIGYGQTISQPYMVAVMTAALQPATGNRVLEVGTGSGYQAAVLAQLVAEVRTFEWVPELAVRARATLARLGIANVRVTTGDGSRGAPGGCFDRIMVTAGAPAAPPPLLDQLAIGGRLVLPRGSRHQQTLTVVRRSRAGFDEEESVGCVFVPLRGESGW